MAGKGFWENLYYTDGAGTPCYTANLISDANKGIAMIEYDNMNQPRRIQFTNGNVTEYVYTSTGEKLRTIHRTAVDNISVPIGNTLALTAANTLSVDSTDYIGSFIFRNGKADKYLFGGGYCTFTTAGQPVYHYYTRDHLGNNRAVVNENGTLEQMTHYYPFGGVYGDTGLNASLQPYKYNGKELDRVHGLDLYDYGARNYDAIIGNWTTMDPLAERTPEVSPYIYCKDNPVNAIDLNGDTIWINYEDHRYLYDNRNLSLNRKVNNVNSNIGFLFTAQNALNMISETDSGNDLLSDLSNSKNNININETIKGSYFIPKSRNKASLLIQQPKNSDFIKYAGTGGNVYWNPNSTIGGPDELGNTTRPPFIGLAHELGHAYSAN